MLSLVQNMSRKFSFSLENVAHLPYIILVVSDNYFTTICCISRELSERKVNIDDSLLDLRNGLLDG